MPLPNRLSMPSALQKLEWVTNPVNYMKTAAQRFPDLFTAEIVGFGDTLVFVHHPQALQEILSHDRKQFAASGAENQILEPLLGNNSVILLQGERHKRRRQLLAPPLHGEPLQAYGHQIIRVTEQCFSQLPSHTFLARTVMQQISLEVILQVVFGLEAGERYRQLKQLLAAIADAFSSPLLASQLYFPFLQRDLGAWSPWGKFVRLRQQIDTLLYAEIADRRHRPEVDRLDILSMLMNAQDETGQHLTDQELRDEMMTLLLAGHETTATALAWGLYWLHRLPDIRAKLLHELQTVGETPDPLDLVRLPYLTAVCNEVLRIHPIAMLTFPRVVQKPTELLGYSLESGTVLVGCIYLLHQRSELYPNPQQFQPERFLERQFSPYEFMPFGGGVRRCAGDAFAAFEMKLVLATVLKRYQLSLATAQPEYPRRRGVTLTPAHGVAMVRH